MATLIVIAVFLVLMVSGVAIASTRSTLSLLAMAFQDGIQLRPGLLAVLAPIHLPNVPSIPMLRFAREDGIPACRAIQGIEPHACGEHDREKQTDGESSHDFASNNGREDRAERKNGRHDCDGGEFALPHA